MSEDGAISLNLGDVYRDYLRTNIDLLFRNGPLAHDPAMHAAYRR
jgi:hypothetical protein